MVTAVPAELLRHRVTVEPYLGDSDFRKNLSPASGPAR
jgi:hypothetical protein